MLVLMSMLETLRTGVPCTQQPHAAESLSVRHCVNGLYATLPAQEK